MVQYRKILELYFKGVSQRTMSASVGSSRNTIRNIIDQAKEKEVTQLTEEMTDDWLEAHLFPSKAPVARGYHVEDWGYVHKELKKKNMTLRLLHKEYEQAARDARSVPYSYRTYCQHYSEYAGKHHLTMPIKRKPGELLEVDWAGSKLFIKDRTTGADIPVYIFVASLPYSQYSYVEGFLDMKSKSWLTGHIHAFEYFDGVTEVTVPDNLKTGVITSIHAEPLLNEAYREMADYYQTVIVPTRTVKPKDKPSVEGNVGFVTRQIIAGLRHAQCFSLQEMNQMIHEKLEGLNQEAFQKRPGNRKTVFEEEEKSYLLPLRQPPFELTDWRTSKVQNNYHIQVDRQFYSVPYEYVQCQVDVRLTTDLLEVYFKDRRIASHKRLDGDAGQYCTCIDHMPEHHRRYLEHSPESALEWAGTVGPHTEKFTRIIIRENAEKRALNILMGVQRLSKRHTLKAIEQAMETLLSISSNPTLTTLKGILKRRQEREKNQKSQSAHTSHTDQNFGFVRGKEYFGGNNK